MAEQLNVFISHSHQDDAFCRALVGALRGTGADVWYDEHNMGSGQLGPTIERELKERSEFVLILSPAALTSAWVEDEARWAYDLYRKDRARAILLVLAAPVDEDDIWLFLRGFKRIEAPGVKPYGLEEAIQRTLHALALGATGAAAPEQGETVEELVTRGKTLQSQKKRGEALLLFQRATQLDPASIDAWDNLHIVFGELRRYPEALAAAEQIIALDPTNKTSWIDKAWLLSKLGRFQEAISAAEHAIALGPNHARSWRMKADILIEARRFQEAFAAVNRAIALDRDNHDGWSTQADVLNYLGRYYEALAAAEYAIRLDGTRPSGWYIKAVALRGLGRTGEADAAVDRADALYEALYE